LRAPCSCCCRAPAPPVTHPLSLHAALPISLPARRAARRGECLAIAATAWPAPRSSHRRQPPSPEHCVSGRHRSIPAAAPVPPGRSEEHTSELQSRENLVCRLLLEKKKQKQP